VDNDIIYSDILNLEKDILHIEETLVEFLNLKYEEEDLIELTLEEWKIMDFLRTHYDYLQKLSVPA